MDPRARSPGPPDLSAAPQYTRLWPQLQTTRPTDMCWHPPSSTEPSERAPSRLSPPGQLWPALSRPHHYQDMAHSET